MDIWYPSYVIGLHDVDGALIVAADDVAHPFTGSEFDGLLVRRGEILHHPLDGRRDGVFSKLASRLRSL